MIADGTLHRSFGSRHPTYERYSAARYSSGYPNVYESVAGPYLVTSFGFPYEIFVYRWETGELVSHFGLNVPSFDVDYEHPTIRTPMKRGLIGGLFTDDAGLIYVFESHRMPSQELAVDYLDVFDPQGRPQWRINLNEALGSQTPVLNSGIAADGGLMYVEVEAPVPGIAVVTAPHGGGRG